MTHTNTIHLHAALPICQQIRPRHGHGQLLRLARLGRRKNLSPQPARHTLGRFGECAALAEEIDSSVSRRSEEHTSELQSPYELVFRLLLEKKKNDHVLD